MSEHPADDALLRLAEADRASDDVAGHVRGCPACQARVAAARAAAGALSRAAPATRAWCPPHTLLAGREELEPAARARLDAHTAACPSCRGALRDLEALLLEPAPAPALAAAGEALAALRARVVLVLDAARRGLELLESTLLPLPAPALVAVRGGEPGAPSATAAEAPFAAGALGLAWSATAGGVDLLARASGAAPRAFRLELGPAEDPAAVWESRSADAEGVVRIAGLQPGRYVLRAYVPQEARPGLVLELELQSG